MVRKAEIARNYFLYKDALRWEAQELKFKLPERIDLIQFHVPMFPSWSLKKKEALLGQPHKQRPDFDNYLKALVDALAPEDGYIWSCKVEKFWTKEGEGRICIYIMTDDERSQLNEILSSFDLTYQKDLRYV